jgi:predicted transcriptional regulator
MVNLTNSLKKLLEKIEKQTKEKESNVNEIPKGLIDKIEDQQDEMTKVLENIDKKEEDVNKENLDESKAELEKEISFLRGKINEGVKENFLVKNKQRDRSFYLYGRTWNEWFYGFVEFYNELKDSLRNIVENNYYNMILKKPIHERSQNENEIIKEVNDLEIELTNLNNNNTVKGGYRKSRFTRKKKYI